VVARLLINTSQISIGQFSSVFERPQGLSAGCDPMRQDHAVLLGADRYIRQDIFNADKSRKES
jgi:hypothetical protein